MKKKSIFLCFFFSSFLVGNIFAQIIELPLSSRVENASAIFEGKVVRKGSFWNTQHTLIFTSNIIEVYKVFKGDVSSSEVDVITEGGSLENEMQAVEPGLNLGENSMGLFIVMPSNVSNPGSDEKNIPSYMTYGGPQGFIKYDLIEKSAADPFRKYSKIDEVLYPEIEKYTGEKLKIIKPSGIDELIATKPEKVCFFKSLFRRSKTKK